MSIIESVPTCSECANECKTSALTLVKGKLVCPQCIIVDNAGEFPGSNVALIASREEVAFSTEGKNHAFHLRAGNGKLAFWGGRL